MQVHLAAQVLSWSTSQVTVLAASLVARFLGENCGGDGGGVANFVGEERRRMRGGEEKEVVRREEEG